MLSYTFIAVVGLRSSKQLIPIVGGAIGGFLVIIIFLALITIITVVAKCMYRSKYDSENNTEGLGEYNYYYKQFP